jgi:oxygen-independent coproporphyrinogen-3 oxidase
MDIALYFHIPFCIHRCAYCDFNTYAGQEAHLPAYVEALCREIEFVARSAAERLTARTIFFGGGTPSLLSTRQFEQILRTIHDNFNLMDDPETSLEANPGTLTRAGLRELRSLGFNRLSLGVQSAHPQELRQLERIHDFFDVIEAVKWARQAGFDNLNLDLIFGLPEQSLERWSDSLRRVVELQPEHLSLYALTIEHGTPFGRWAQRGLLPMPDPDLAADMYEWAGEYLETHGYVQYEISNWARDIEGRRSKVERGKLQAQVTNLSTEPSSHSLTPAYACRHNLTYWRGEAYLGFGAGAHGFAKRMRVANVLRIKTYIERIAESKMQPAQASFPLTPATVNRTPISPRVAMQEFMLTGLRLTREGVTAQGFAEKFGTGLVDVFGKEIRELVGLGLLEWVGNEPCEGFKPSQGLVRLTRRGRLLGNQVFLRFVGD